MKTAKKTLMFVLIALMVFMVVPQSAQAAEEHSVSTPEELTAALGSAASGDTIKLLTDIDYNTGIEITGRTITFDLNGHMLNVINGTGDGLEVGSGGVVNLSGSGEFNVTSNADSSYGVYAHNGGQATLTSATATGESGTGACAENAGSSVWLKGDATSMVIGGIGACAYDGGAVRVGGSAMGNSIGASAEDNNSLVEVGANTVGLWGAYASSGGSVRVSGIVGGHAVGVKTMGSGSMISVAGDVFAIGTEAVGAVANDGGTATIDGTIITQFEYDEYIRVYIKLQDVEKTASDGVPGTAPYEKYLIFTDSSNTIRVNADAVCKIGTTLYPTLEAALASVGGGETKTIILLANIDCNTGIVITGKTITFDLNGYTLSVTNNMGHGLEVGSSGVVSLSGSGEFNVTTDFGVGYYGGVYAHSGGRATVTNATATRDGNAGAYAIGTGSYIEVTGDAKSTSGGSSNFGAFASDGGTVTVGGNAEGVVGTYATGSNSFINVTGNVTSSLCAVHLEAGGCAVNVHGNVSVSGDNSYGVLIYDNDSTVLIDGNLTVTGMGAVGVNIFNRGVTIIKGTLTAPTYIILDDVPKTEADGVPGESPLGPPYETYLAYTEGNSAVYVKISVTGATIGPTGGTFDRNPEHQADVTTTITWNDASAVTDVKLGATSIAGCYSVVGNTLTINKGYLASEPVGDLVLTVVFNTGAPVTLTITITDTGPPVCQIGTTSYTNLETALAAVGEGETKTIKLLADIEYDAGITVENRTVIFDLNVHTLNVISDGGHTLDVGEGGVVDITGEGEFNVTSNAESGYGVYAHNGGKATVTGVTVTGDSGIGVYAKGDNSSDRSEIVALGDVVTDGENAIGVSVDDGGKATVNGSLTVSGTNAIGIRAKSGNPFVYHSVVYIEGTFTAPDEEESYIVLDWNEAGTESGSIAAEDGYADGDYLVYEGWACTVLVNGNFGPVCAIGATVYETLAEALDEAEDGTVTTIKMLRDYDYEAGIAVFGKTVIFDLNGCELNVYNNGGDGLEVSAGGVVDITDTSAEGDGGFEVVSAYYYGVYAHDGGQATVTVAGGQQGAVCAESGAIVHVKDMAYGNGYGVIAAGGSTVTVDGEINAYEYIRLEGVAKLESDGVPGTGDYESYLVYSDDNGNIVRVKNTVISAVLSPAEAVFDLDAQEDISTAITWNDAETVTGVVYGSEPLESPADFTVNENTLTITEEFLSGLHLSEGDRVELVISFDVGESATLTATATAAPVATLESIAITTAASKLVYTVGESLDTTGMVVTGAYSDSSTKVETITAANVTGFDSSAPAVNQVLTVTVGGKTTTYTVTINKAVSTDKTLVSITAPADISGVANGTAKTAAALGLPSKVTLVTDDGNMQADVTWDVASSSYDPADPDEQTFEVEGTVPLPAGVINPDDVELSVTISVTVNAAPSNNDGGGSGGSSSSTPATPTYKVTVSGTNISGTTLPVSVNTNAGSATVDLGTTLAKDIFAGSGTAVLTVPSIPGVNSYTIGIPATSLSVSQGEGALTFSTSAGSLTIPADMLEEMAGTEGSSAGITIAQGDKSGLPDEIKTAIGDRPIVRLTLTLDGTQTEWNNPDAPVTVSIPYTPTATELANPESIVIWYIDGSGKAVSVPNGRYDPATGTVTFTTTHFSYYVVSFKQVSFKDVAKEAWYAKAVSFIAAREIATGTGNSNFSPEAKLTRGQFIVMLMNAYGITSDTNPKDNFADAGGTYYTGYLAAAKRLGISVGVGNNLFAPNKEITHQEMFTLLYNALKVIGELPQGNTGKPLSSFSDSNQIASWENDAMKPMLQTGSISGSSGKLSPTASTTRAEMAQVLYNLLSK